MASQSKGGAELMAADRATDWCEKFLVAVQGLRDQARQALAAAKDNPALAALLSVDVLATVAKDMSRATASAMKLAADTASRVETETNKPKE